MHIHDVAVGSPRKSQNYARYFIFFLLIDAPSCHKLIIMHDRAFFALAASVRARRRTLRLRQEELADLADCSTRFVHMLEQGKPTVRLDKVLDVLEVVGLGLTVRPGSGDIDVQEGE